MLKIFWRLNMQKRAYLILISRAARISQMGTSNNGDGVLVRIAPGTLCTFVQTRTGVGGARPWRGTNGPLVALLSLTSHLCYFRKVLSGTYRLTRNRKHFSVNAQFSRLWMSGMRRNPCKLLTQYSLGNPHDNAKNKKFDKLFNCRSLCYTVTNGVLKIFGKRNLGRDIF